jgi:tetratricopeptide (TPR) repeat protein
MLKNTIKIHPELKKAIEENELVVFVGAGISYELINSKNQKLGDWKNLVACILENLKSNGYEVEHLISLVDKSEPLEVLKLIETNKQQIPQKAICNFVKSFYEFDNKNTFSLQKKIFDLCPKIITTNYDTAFEEAVPKLRRNKAYKGRNYELMKHKEKDAIFLIKLHGCAEDADSMVLLPSDYVNLYSKKDNDAERLIFVLENIIINNTILFLGIGLGDFQIKNILKKIENLQGKFNQKHFIITLKPLDSSLSFLEPILISDYRQIENIIDNLIEIKREAEENEQLEVKKHEKGIEVTTKKIEELSKQSFSDECNEAKRLLEREALKYYRKGLKYSLTKQFALAMEEYKQAIELKKYYHEAFNGYGFALASLAKTKKENEMAILCYQAFENFEKAIEIKPDFYDAYFNWGNSLVILAQIKEDKDADMLYNTAFEKYKKAIVIKPDFHEVYYNWGNALITLLEGKEGKEVEKLYEQVINMYKKVVEIKPDFSEALMKLGLASYALAEIKQDKDAEDLYNQTFENFKQAIKYENNAYKFAGFYKLEKEKDKALFFLDKSLSNNEVEVEFVEKDDAWKDYRNDKDFIEILNKYRTKH